MSNEELKKKIAKIIDTTEKPCNCLTVSECLAKTGCKYHNRNDGTTCFSYARAEALIAAGIGDVQEAEHRAVVAELVVKNLNDIFTFDYQTVFEQAEKELAEEGKDDQNI